jgi:hypothetical protein
VLLKERVSVANNSGLRRMIAGSVANNVGLSARQLHLIPVKKCADCRFACFLLQVVTVSYGFYCRNQKTLFN